jgi:hypothetical protein
MMKPSVYMQVPALLLGCIVSTGKSDLTYDFESPLPASFVVNPIGPPSGMLSGGIDGGLYRLRDPQIHSGPPPVGAAAADSNQIFGNVRISATVNAAGNSPSRRLYSWHAWAWASERLFCATGHERLEYDG